MKGEGKHNQEGRERETVTGGKSPQVWCVEREVARIAIKIGLLTQCLNIKQTSDTKRIKSIHEIV